MAEPSAAPVVDRVLAEAGVKPWSIVGGSKLSNLLFKAIELDRALRNSPGESVTVYVEGDWAFDIPEDGSDEAWWYELQLLDPRDPDINVRTIQAVLSLSDVELEGLIAAATQILAEGRKRFA